MQISRAGQPWYKEPWPWILMAGPGLVAIAGGVTIWLAVISFDGLVSDDYYKQGLAVNQRLQRDHEAGRLGVKAQVMREGEHLRLFLSLNSEAKDKFPEQLTLRIVHPTQAGFDQSVQMQQEGHGFYVGKLANNITGRWHVSLEEPKAQWRLMGDWVADRPQALELASHNG